jgi:hypothetical protein
VCFLDEKMKKKKKKKVKERERKEQGGILRARRLHLIHVELEMYAACLVIFVVVDILCPCLAPHLDDHA